MSATATLRPASRPAPTCSIARSLEVLGEKWTLLIVREAMWGRTRFSEFKERLGVSSDILADRLTTLVDHGVMERRSYREDGARERYSYHLTESGRALRTTLAALTAWGDAYRPNPSGPATIYRELATGAPTRVAFVDGSGRELSSEEVETVRGPGDSSGRLLG
ncbi:MAG TPA: helix-turn-helix domain-containing protein [Lacisediminihabitans sp.]|uniref:winged helix-turn-helix transcriptional regulator n=1 Tax=Lacisediminihabitans sp. TaxID=2787631 RepID=UPI002ED8153F